LSKAATWSALRHPTSLSSPLPVFDRCTLPTVITLFLTVIGGCVGLLLLVAVMYGAVVMWANSRPGP